MEPRNKINKQTEQKESSRYGKQTGDFRWKGVRQKKKFFLKIKIKKNTGNNSILERHTRVYIKITIIFQNKLQIY